MTESGAEKGQRFVIVFSGSGYASESIAHLARELEAKGHEVEVVSYLGLAANKAKSIAEKGVEGLRSMMRTVTGKLTGEDPLGLKSEEGGDAVDVIVATSPDLVAATRAMMGGESVRVGLMVDLHWRPEWTSVDTDVLVMPHPMFRDLALRKGWREEAVITAGVPLPEAFSRELDVSAIRERFGLSSEQGRLALVIAEDVDDVRLERLVRQISLADRPVQPLFYIGADTVAGEVLRRAAAKHGVMARMFGEVKNLEEYYAACDYVLAEAANPLVYPLLALDKPVLLLDSDIDTSPVGAFLRDEGAAVLVPDLLRLAAELDALSAHPEELEAMRQATARVVDQEGARKVADALDAVARDKDAYLGQGRDEEQDSGEKEQLAGGGAFEVIGSSGRAPAPERAPERERRGGYEPPRPREDRRFDAFHEPRLTAAEAKEELAALILMEREIEKRLSEATRYLGVWENRLDLAREAGADDLAREAKRYVDNYRREESNLVREMERVRDQKEKLKRRVKRPGGGGGGSYGGGRGGGFGRGGSWEDPDRVRDLENRFRSMELDRDLDQLKDRLDD